MWCRWILNKLCIYLMDWLKLKIENWHISSRSLISVPNHQSVASISVLGCNRSHQSSICQYLINHHDYLIFHFKTETFKLLVTKLSAGDSMLVYNIIQSLFNACVVYAVSTNPGIDWVTVHLWAQLRGGAFKSAILIKFLP